MEVFVTINPYTTPFEKTLHETKNYLVQKFSASSFVLCREVATHEHYHLYFKDPTKEFSDTTRNALRRSLNDWFKGEVRITKRQVEDRIRAIAYTIKDGNYITYRIDWLDFLKAKEISHPKKKGFKELMLEFHHNSAGKNEQQLVCEVLTIFETCLIPIDIYRIAKIVRLALSSHNMEYRRGLIERICYEI